MASRDSKHRRSTVTRRVNHMGCLKNTFAGILTEKRYNVHGELLWVEFWLNSLYQRGSLYTTYPYFLFIELTLVLYKRPYNDLIVSFSWFMIKSEEISYWRPTNDRL